MSARDTSFRAFGDWIQSHGGSLDASVMDVVTFPGQLGRGAIALKDIPEGYTLFTIPRSLTLSARTSTLPNLLGPIKWRNYELDKGWAGLILCMMWEEAQGASSKWYPYLSELPTEFDTPMFWKADELEELRGTSVVDKIGREEAERDYYKKLLPAIHSRQDIFSTNVIPEFYSLERYHIQGSRILSRSFQVEQWEGEGGDKDENAAADTSAESYSMDVADTSIGSGNGMDVDEDEGPAPAAETHHPEQEGSDDEDEEDTSDVAMVPMADMLNARYGSENAKLFHEATALKMVTTKHIPAGEQIWNTYGDLANSDLLRRYGHVDMLPLPGGGQGNPADVVEIRADLVISVLPVGPVGLTPDASKERIEWWLEEGGDDAFILEDDLDIPEAMVSLIRLLLLNSSEWEKVREKGKPPKPKVDAEVLSLVAQVLRRRLDEYPTSLETDAVLLNQDLPTNKRHAVIVRAGEKSLLHRAIEKVELVKDSQGKKRRVSAGSAEETGQSKKSKR
ncbi:SET domain-containing protein [Athelia psychrophila]|uniref:SET domain-containing protein n=1 Tax=Athelia psychrophila TaxID=1759441 RepID=A0A166X4R8_9AGAM|nr:SET domain-containing protein [Fibularhizoctonia sp. CBS 109695]